MEIFKHALTQKSLAIAFSLVLLSGCSQPFHPENQQANSQDSGQGTPQDVLKPEISKTMEGPVSLKDGNVVVFLSPEVQAKSGFRVTPLKSESISGDLKLYGSVIPFPDITDLMMRVVTAQADFQKAKANSINVKASYARAQANYHLAQATHAKAKANAEVALQSYERLKILNADDKNISDKVLEGARGSQLTSQADVMSSEAQLQTASADIQTSQALLKTNQADIALAQGTLRAIEATTIQRLGPVMGRWLLSQSPQIQSLLDRKQVLVQVSFPLESPPPQSLSQRLVGRTADGKTFPLQYVSESIQIDSRIQGRSYYYLASNKNGEIQPGMSLTVSLPLNQKMAGSLVPNGSVVWSQGKAWVYCQKDASHFIRIEIPVDRSLTEGWFVPQGKLSSPSRVVTQGAQLLLSEEFKAQLQAGGGGE